MKQVLRIRRCYTEHWHSARKGRRFHWGRLLTMMTPDPRNEPVRLPPCCWAFWMAASFCSGESPACTSSTPSRPAQLLDSVRGRMGAVANLYVKTDEVLYLMCNISIMCSVRIYPWL